MKKERMIQAVRLQENLSSLRKIAGWTAEELGEMLGVSKQNISNLENNVTKLSQAQYIAIRHLLDYKASTEHGHSILPQMIELLVDHLELVGNDYNSVMNIAQNIGTAAGTMKGQKLKSFAEIMLKTTFTRASDFSEIDGLLKEAIENPGNYDWTADIIAGSK